MNKKKTIQWFSLLIVLETVLTFLINWDEFSQLGSYNVMLLFILIPTILIGISFFILLILPIIRSEFSEAVQNAVFRNSKICLVAYSIISIALLLSSIYFFITTDQLPSQVNAKISPYAILGYFLSWELIIFLVFTREEFKGKQKFWIGLPVLFAGNYFLWHSLVDAGRYLQSFLLNVYRTETKYIFENYQWWQFLLPIKEFDGTWPFGLIVTYLLETIIGPSGVWYLFQAILMIVAFFMSWKVFRSKIFSYFLAILLGFSTHNYHAFQYSGVTGFYLLQALFIVLLYLSYEFIRQKENNLKYLLILIPTLIFTAIFYEGWLDFFASVWLIALFLFFYFRHKNQIDYQKNLIIIFLIFNIVAAIYIYLKFTYIEFAHAEGESAVVFVYSKHHIWRAVEDLVSNYLTNLYMTLTNFFPPAFITSNSLYQYTEFLETRNNLVYSHYVFYWRYFAGVLAALFYVGIIKLIKKVLKDSLFSTYFPLVLFMIMVAVNGATHTIIQFRPMKALPVLGYYVQNGIMGLSLCIAYLFHLFNLKTSNKKIVLFVAIFSVLIILWSSIRRPNYLWHMIEVGGLDHQGPYPNPLIVLLNKIRKFIPGFLST